MTSRWRGNGRHAAQGELASRQGGVERSRGGMVDQLAGGVEDDPVHGPGKSSIGRSHPNRCRKYIYRNVQVGCHHSLHTHGQIYMSDNMMWWMDIYIYTCRTGDISCWVDDMRGLSGPGCLHRASSILGARVHHPSQAVPRTWPTGRGTNGQESTLSPPVDTLARAPACPGTPPAGARACPGPPHRSASMPGRPSLSRDEIAFFFSKSAENWAVPKLGPPP